MTAKGHILLSSALAYLPILEIQKSFGVDIAFLSFSIIIFGSILPDIDEPNSYIGRKFPILSWILILFGLKHRGLTHILIVPIVITAFALYAVDSEIITITLLSLAFGILTHDVGDSITTGGINGFFYPLFPAKKFVLLPGFLRFQTFSIFEYFLVSLLFVLNLILYSGFVNAI